jgi:esterase/lipase
MQYIETKGRNNIAYKDNFSKVKNPEITIVFLCGYMSDMEGAKSLFLEEVCTQNNLGYLAFDYSGHGKSSGDFLDGSISEWTEESIEIINKLVETPIIPIGSSMGGWISLLISLQLKNKVKGIINIASAVDFTENLMWNTFTENQKIALENENKITINRGGYDYCVTKKLIEDGRENLLLNGEISIYVPVILLHGMRDESVPVENSIKLAAKLSSKNVQIIISKDSDHRMSEEPDLQLLGESLLKLLD